MKCIHQPFWNVVVSIATTKIFQIWVWNLHFPFQETVSRATSKSYDKIQLHELETQNYTVKFPAVFWENSRMRVTFGRGQSGQGRENVESLEVIFTIPWNELTCEFFFSRDFFSFSDSASNRSNFWHSWSVFFDFSTTPSI